MIDGWVNQVALGMDSYPSKSASLLYFTRCYKFVFTAWNCTVHFTFYQIDLSLIFKLMIQFNWRQYVHFVQEIELQNHNNFLRAKVSLSLLITHKIKQ